ncbi:class I SAM-dependent methyltransferase [Kitasatospora sp. RB6PN24]|uniref:class I SAM-dependent methyltransferase n=1 Tax=Kitasatospora humi TaxID=2893891 RepID=UPI001E2AB887|nr:class I SAM-dependent methyltransferase [Kitasatospora humi]MCC9308384.1 class I SAM-dependent methyltransferase [Kitasatospora humi]
MDDSLRAANARQFDRSGYVSGYQRGDVRHLVRIRETVDVLLRHLPAGPGRRERPLVLDVGSGGGITARALLDRGIDVIAGDIVTGGLQTADPRAALLQFDASRPFPIADGALDGIVAGDVIHMLFDPVAFLRECRRVLRPGGILVVTTLNLAGAQDRLRFLVGQPPYQIDPFNDVLKLHIRPFTARGLARAFEAAGLRSVALRSNHWVLRVRRRRLLLRWPARRWPALGFALVMRGVPAEGTCQALPGRR